MANPKIQWRGKTVVVTDTYFDTEWVVVTNAYWEDCKEWLYDCEIDDLNDEMPDKINEAFADEYCQEFYLALK